MPLILPWKQLDNFRQGAAASGAPVVTITHTKNGTFSITFRGTNGAVIYCDPGDGSAVQAKTLLGSGTDVVFSYANDSTERVVSVSGDLGDVVYLASASNVITDVHNISKFANNTFLNLSGNLGLTLVLAELTPLSQLVTLYVNVSGASGDASALSGLNNLSVVYINNSSVSGSLSAFSTLTLLTQLWLYNTSVTGDLSSLASLSSLSNLRIYNTTMTYSSTTSWFTATSGTFNFSSCLTLNTEVDRLLIDLNNALWSNCTIYIDGTNPAPTAAAAAALAGLAGRGCTVYTN